MNMDRNIDVIYKEISQGIIEAIDAEWDGAYINVEYFVQSDDFNDDENTLVGKLIGLTLGEEEYTKADGTTAVRIYVDKCRDIKKIRANDGDAY